MSAHKNEARPVAPTTPGFHKNTHLDSEAHSVQAQAAKDFETLRAEAALRGITVHRLHDKDHESFVVGRWNLSRTVATLEEASALVKRIGGPR